MFYDSDNQFFFDEFAEPASIGASKVNVIFDSQQVEYREGFTTVMGYTPQITIQTSDVVAHGLDQGSAITVRGISYQIAQIEDDSTGISTAQLHRI